VKQTIFNPTLLVGQNYRQCGLHSELCQFWTGLRERHTNISPSFCV